MKVILSVLCLALLALQADGHRHRTVPRCPPQDPMDHTIHLPNPLDCFTFYRCDHGIAKLESCPGGLHFNAVLQVCDWPNNANCHVSTTTSTTTSATVTTEETTTPPTEATDPPTEAPTDEPTEEATDPPTEAPTDEPTEEATDPPTEAPTDEPTEEATDPPTEAPTDEPTEEATDPPTEAPTDEPTEEATDPPTEAPTDGPTEPPTEAPTDEPTEEPTEVPTEGTTEGPTDETEEPSTTTSKPGLPTSCPPWWTPSDHPEVLLPHETRCRVYYKCVRGVKIPQLCDLAYEFSPRRRICRPFLIAGCKHQSDKQNRL